MRCLQENGGENSSNRNNKKPPFLIAAGRAATEVGLVFGDAIPTPIVSGLWAVFNAKL